MRAALAGALILLSATVAVGDEAAVQAALSASDAWLKLVDAGDYGRSWAEAAKLFRAAVDRKGWDKQVGAVRKPLGNVVSRKVLSKKYAESLPGAPDGKYVVIQYETVFQNKKSAVETVTPMLDGGTWRVSGYYVR